MKSYWDQENGLPDQGIRRRDTSVLVPRAHSQSVALWRLCLRNFKIISPSSSFKVSGVTYLEDMQQEAGMVSRSSGRSILSHKRAAIMIFMTASNQIMATIKPVVFPLSIWNEYPRVESLGYIPNSPVICRLRTLRCPYRILQIS